MASPDHTPGRVCECALCRWARLSSDAQQDLEDNYQKYLEGDLVSKDDKE